MTVRECCMMKGVCCIVRTAGGTTQQQLSFDNQPVQQQCPLISELQLTTSRLSSLTTVLINSRISDSSMKMSVHDSDKIHHLWPLNSQRRGLRSSRWDWEYSPGRDTSSITQSLKINREEILVESTGHTLVTSCDGSILNHTVKQIEIELKSFENKKHQQEDYRGQIRHKELCVSDCRMLEEWKLFVVAGLLYCWRWQLRSFSAYLDMVCTETDKYQVSETVNSYNLSLTQLCQCERED